MDEKQALIWERFTDSCRIYLGEKKLLAKMEERRKDDLAHPEKVKERIRRRRGYFQKDILEDEELRKFMEDDTAETERVLKAMVKSIGKRQRDILYAMYVEGKSQEEAGQQFGLTRRQVQYGEKKWIRYLFEDGILNEAVYETGKTEDLPE